MVLGAPPPEHPGFALSEVLDRHERFIEYAEQSGASVAGSSGAQGDAPKLLLTRDRDDRWHADGVLPDGRVADHWIIKFPRGKSSPATAPTGKRWSATSRRGSKPKRFVANWPGGRMPSPGCRSGWKRREWIEK